MAANRAQNYNLVVQFYILIPVHGEPKMGRIYLAQKYPSSKPCSCEVCLSFCKRPGWWTVEEAAKAIEAGYAHRMMLEIAPELTFGVLSPAFKGNEDYVALQIFADQGCTFLKDSLCELHGTGLQPLECRFCHHTRRGLGEKCHLAIEEDWHTKEGQELVKHWSEISGVFGAARRDPGIMPKRSYRKK